MAYGPRFNFTRRARNASFSNRTCKLGTKKGTAIGRVRSGFIIAGQANTEILLVNQAMKEFVDG